MNTREPKSKEHKSPDLQHWKDTGTVASSGVGVGWVRVD